MMFRSISFTLHLHLIVSFIIIINPHPYSLFLARNIPPLLLVPPSPFLIASSISTCRSKPTLEFQARSLPPNLLDVNYLSVQHQPPHPTTGHHDLKYPALAPHYFDADPSHTPQTLLCSIHCCALAQSATTSICRHHR